MYTHAQRETCECTWLNRHRRHRYCRRRRHRERVRFRLGAFGTVRFP